MKRYIFSILAAVFFLHTTAQDICMPVGWATQNGGVTGGGTAAAAIVSNYSDFKAAIENKNIKVVHISGTITIPGGGRITMQGQTGKTIFGLPGSKLISTDISKSGSGIFYIKQCTDLILQNIVFEGPGAYDTDGYDHLCLDNCQNIWVDHCEFHDGVDGNFDIKNMSDYISVTWCTFSYEKPPIAGGSGGSNDHRYTNLIGSSATALDDKDKLSTTFQYCWWGEGCRERMPRVRFGKIHMVNNLFTSSVSNHCIRAGEQANILAEGNYFDKQNTPIDIYKDNSVVAEKNNAYINCRGTNNNPQNVFTPPYSIEVADPYSIVAPIKKCAGATLPSYGGCSDCNTTATIKYKLTSTTPSNGSIIPSSGTYAPNSEVLITAVANQGYVFSNWGGDANGTENPASITMDSDKHIEAYFEQAQKYTITANASNGGIIAPNINGEYYESTQLATVATAYIGYQFTGWSGSINEEAKELSFTVQNNVTINALFEKINEASIYEIENGYYETGVAIFENKNTGFSGTGYVNTENASNMWTEITVYAENAGSYKCELFYAAISDRPLQVTINGKQAIEQLAMPSTQEWTTWQSFSFTLDLATGANTIRFTALTDEGAPNLDKIHIQANLQPSTTQLITLEKGWNLISINVIPNEDAITYITSNPSVSEIKTTDEYWIKDQPAYFNTLTTIEPGKGYIIKMENQSILEITGEPTSTPVLDLLPEGSGWFLLGCPYQESTQLDSIFNEHNSQAIKDFTNVWYPQNNSTGLTLLEPGKGYFILK